MRESWPEAVDHNCEDAEDDPEIPAFFVFMVEFCEFYSTKGMNSFLA